MKAAAESWAACQEDSVEMNATCDSIAQAELEEISGSMSVWTDEVAEKVKALGVAMLESQEIVLHKLQAILLETLTDALNCSDAVLDKLAEKAQQTSDGFMPNATMGPRNVSDKECRIVWGLARYYCKVHTKDLNETETEDLSDSLSTDLGTAGISGVRPPWATSCGHHRQLCRAGGARDDQHSYHHYHCDEHGIHIYIPHDQCLFHFKHSTFCLAVVLDCTLRRAALDAPLPGAWLSDAEAEIFGNRGDMYSACFSW